MNRKLLAAPLLLTTVMTLAIACGGDSDSPTSTPGAGGSNVTAQAGTTTAGSPTAAPTTVESTSTPTSVPPTATAAATATPAPTDTPTATPEPPTATPEPPTATPVPPTATTAPAPPVGGGGGGPGGGGPGGGSGGGGGGSAYITAQNLKFAPTTLYAHSGSVTITLSNQDNFVPHNISVTGFGTSATCTGPCTVSLSFTAGPGSYGFLCTIHPYMTGTLVVQ